MINIERRKFYHSLVFPAFFIFVIWLIKFSEVILNANFAVFGIYPLKEKGLIGIITAPLIHADFSHLISNTMSLFVLSVGVFYFYRKIAYKIFFLIYITSNIWVWLFARPSYHIGASGLVYGLATFLFASGIIRRSKRLLALSLLVAFWYGSMIWGIFPMQTGISWESHFMGMVSGIVLSIYYRRKPIESIEPKKPKIPYSNQTFSCENIEIEYSFKKNEEIE